MNVYYINTMSKFIKAFVISERKKTNVLFARHDHYRMWRLKTPFRCVHHKKLGWDEYVI